ncbi:hypothetical protein BDR05DRAFT_1004557 [Suillus weaverae]|nr:hypothetical protein BDR05DRAFT_1004557 [Suillus weaverae]
MPHQSQCQALLNQIDSASLDVAMAWVEHAIQDDGSSDSSMSDIRTPSPSSPLSPVSPMFPMSPMSSMSMSTASGHSGDSIVIHEQFAQLLGSLTALWDEVEMARVLHQPDKPPM